MRVAKPIIDPLSKNSKQGLNDALSNFNRSNLFVGIPAIVTNVNNYEQYQTVNVRPCLLYTSPSPRDRQKSRMPSSA